MSVLSEALFLATEKIIFLNNCSCKMNTFWVDLFFIFLIFTLSLYVIDGPLHSLTREQGTVMWLLCLKKAK